MLITDYKKMISLLNKKGLFIGEIDSLDIKPKNECCCSYNSELYAFINGKWQRFTRIETNN